MRAMRSSAGLTLVEFLVAVAVLGVGLGVLAWVLAGASTANRANYERVVALETSQIVVQVLEYHVRLAGYVGFDREDRVSSLCGPSFEVETATVEGARHDIITVRYFEDRTFGGSVSTNNRQCFDDRITRVTFDADGGFLRQNGAAIVGGVARFEVVEALSGTGDVFTVFPLDDLELEMTTGVLIRVVFDDGTVANVPVPFVNRQRVFLGTDQDVDDDEQEE